ncbi:MAG: carbonic anhydrase [Candidatus Micrarchaeia archaeon]
MEIVVSCMDRRLNNALDSMNNGKQIFVRNAGGNVAGVEQTLRYLVDSSNISEIKLVAHTDCGAMGYVFGALNGKESESLHSELVKQFKGLKLASRLELEKNNELVQKSKLESMFAGKGIGISSMLIESKPSEPKRHIAAITNSSSAKYAELAKKLGVDADDCYFMQANSIEELLPDITLAIEKLGIKEFLLVAEEQSQYRQKNAELERLRARGLASKASFSLVKL